jgi:hypothetical protein
VLIDHIGVVPEVYGHPLAVLKGLQHNRVGHRRWRLAAPIPDADIRLHIDEDLSLCRDHRQRLSKPTAETRQDHGLVAGCDAK